MRAIVIALVVLLPYSAAADDAAFVPAVIRELKSPLQEGATRIRILMSENLKSNRRYPVVYVLPVEPRDLRRYGDGLLEIKRSGLHEKFPAIFVAPTFVRLPWYADHPTNAKIQQEAYFLKDVIPFIEESYPVITEPKGRLLLGFSKSGWGAWSLLLRHPEVFGKAAAWDAPLMMDRLEKYGAPEIFGSDENFAKYRITHLLRSHASSLAGQPRLILTGYGNFRDDHEKTHALLSVLKIPHEYRDGPKRKHLWGSGWVPEAVELLLAGTNGPQFEAAQCQGSYPKHLQGVCTNDNDAIYWSFTDRLVKTDLFGRVEWKFSVADHHGDLCHHDGKIYVAVNLGQFNRPAGKADSWIYVYQAETLGFVARHPVPEVVHGAGGIAYHDGRFLVVGGLPEGVNENYLYEYDESLKFRKRHTLDSGYTLMGIQTAAFANDHWWFGCYGKPQRLLKADKNLKLVGQWDFDGSLGIVGLPDGRLFVASGKCQKDKGCTGRVTPAVLDEKLGLRLQSTVHSADRWGAHFDKGLDK